MLGFLLIALFFGLSERPLTGEEQQALKEAKKDLRSGDPDRIYEAASRLIRMRHKQAVAALTDAFKTDEKVRIKIAKALADRSSYLSEAVSDYGMLLERAALCKDQMVLKYITRALVSARRPNVANVASFLVKLAVKTPTSAPLVSNVFNQLPLDNWKEVGFAITAAKALWHSEHGRKILSAVNRALLRNFKTPDEASLWFDKNKNRPFRDVLGEFRKMVDRMRRTIMKHVQDKIELMKKIPPEERKKECLARLDDKEESAEIKEFALRELGVLKANDAADKIATFLKSNDERLRRAAIWALAQLQEKRYSSKIAELLSSESEAERLMAVKALKKLAAAPPKVLNDALRNEESEKVLRTVLETVAYLKPDGAADVIVERFFVKSGDTLVLKEKGEKGRLVARTLAAVAVGGGEKVLKALLGLTESDDAAIRYAGCEGLAGVGGGVARARLVEMARKEKETGVRAAAIRALIRLGKIASDEMDVLFEGLGAAEKEVREAALDGLRRVTGVAGNIPLNTEKLASVVKRLLKQNHYEALVRLMDVPPSRLARLKGDAKKHFGLLLISLGDEHMKRKALTKAVEVYRQALSFVGQEQEGRVRLKIASVLEREAKFAEAYEELKHAQGVLPPEQRESVFLNRLALVERIAKEKKDKSTAAALLKECSEDAKRLKLSDSAKKRLSELKKALLGG